MSSQIPDPARGTGQPGVVPAPAAGTTPTARPRRPAAKSASARGPVQPAAAADAVAPTPPRPGRGLFRSVPAWAISMLAHVVVLLVMALMSIPAIEKARVTVITAPQAEAEREFEDVEELVVEDVDIAEISELPDVVIPESMPTVEDVAVVANAADVDAAPLAVALTDFSAQTAPAADMLSTVGAIGGTAGGFGGRADAARLAAAGGGGADTEQAVDRALAWIAMHQMPDGGWSFDFQQCPSCQGRCSHGGDDIRGRDRCGATALALLPFLGRGYTHRDGPYKQQIEKGIAFLAAMTMQGNGKSYGPGGSLYSQGLAGIALSESYAMTQDARLAVPTQLALNFIMDAQDPRGGGWRYSPRQAGDTSAVGWQLMALKSGNMAYLQVNPLTIRKVVQFLDSVQTRGGAAYGYLDPGDRPGTNAVGLLCRMYLGWKKDHPSLQEGVLALAKRGPTNDLYYTYYATQIMHHMEGDAWQAWNERMKRLLLPTQSTQDHETGSWHEGVNGGHGARAAGRLYCTALATMTLEVYYRHLPIYRDESIDGEFKE